MTTATNRGAVCARGVVVDEVWKVAVVQVEGNFGLPSAEPAPGESPQQAMERVLAALGLEVQLVANLGERSEPEGSPHRGFVFQRIGAPGEDPQGTLQWWPSSRAMKELLLESDRRWVRRALGPC